MTNEAKNHLLRYFRFQRGFPYVATECWGEDVVVSDGIQLICVEVKVSWADYRHEFSKAKHRDGSCYWHKMLRPKNNPNRVFFAAPDDLAVRITADLEITAPYYGILSIGSTGQTAVLRKAQVLHKNEVQQRSLKDLVMRLTSELITLRGQAKT
jgi:hypothetical protein